MGYNLNALSLPLEAMADQVPSDDPDRPDNFSDGGQQWRTLKTRTRGPIHPVTRNRRARQFRTAPPAHLVYRAGSPVDVRPDLVVRPVSASAERRVAPA